MASTIDLLGRQHQEVLKVLAETEMRLEDGAATATLAEYLEGEVQEHFRLEEESLFPVLAEHPAIAGGPLRVMQMEHEAFRGLLADLRLAISGGDGPAQAQVAADLIALLRGHIAKEDEVLFPMANALLGEEALRRVDGRAREIA
jgi:hemerythrin-like domain-containing protein